MVGMVGMVIVRGMYLYSASNPDLTMIDQQSISIDQYPIPIDTKYK